MASDDGHADGKSNLPRAAASAAAVGAAGAGIGLLVARRPKALDRALSHLPGRARPEPAGRARRLLDGLGQRVGSLAGSGGSSNEKAGRSRGHDLKSRRRERKAGRERRRRQVKT